MEFKCPDCGKRLRAPDHLTNPLVRCRQCGTTFRPREEAARDEAIYEATIQEETVEPTPSVKADIELQGADSPSAASVPEIRTRSPRRSPGRKAGGGLGVIGVILLILLSKAPRLLKVFEKDEPPPPPPVRINENEMRAIEEMIKNVPPAALPEGPEQPADPFVVQPQPDEPAPEEESSPSN